MSRRRTRAKSQISTHMDQMRRVKVMGCGVNFADQSQVWGKLHRLNIHCVFFLQLHCWAFLRDISPCTALCPWCHAEVALCHLLLCIRFRHVEPFSVLNLSLYAQRGPATRSHRQHSFKECVFKLREDVRVPFGLQRAAMT